MFQALLQCVSFGRHSVNCAGLRGTAWSCAVVVAAQRALCESCPAHQVHVVPSLVDASAHLEHETVCS